MKKVCGKPFPQLNLIRWWEHCLWFWASFVVLCLFAFDSDACVFVCKCKAAFVCKYGRNMLCNDHKPHMWSCLCICAYEPNLIKMMFSRLTSHFHNAVLTSISHWRDSSCTTAWFLTGCFLVDQFKQTCADHFSLPNKLRPLFLVSASQHFIIFYSHFCSKPL